MSNSSLSFAEISQLLQAEFGAEVLINSNAAALQPWLEVSASQLLAVCRFLRDDSRLYFDYLECLSGVDLGPKTQKIGVVYHLMSIPRGHQLVLKCFVDRPLQTEKQVPTLPSVVELWRTADWHEREAYDLMGITFSDHPDLRRILLPEDWVGHPLRKDYQNPEFYHGIQTEY
ncbi:MAG TPA: NADH-quinone oxidoreductase subunit C [Bacteroidetes bacterium]|nr:NADH-quinone oxidoreductase subunit C [Bacteroidota bacterium]